MNFKIIKTDKGCSTYGYIEFKAVDENGNDIFGAKADLSKGYAFDGVEKKWEINFGSIGAMELERAEVQLAVINEAYKELIELNK